MDMEVTTRLSEAVAMAMIRSLVAAMVMVVMFIIRRSMFQHRAVVDDDVAQIVVPAASVDTEDMEGMEGMDMVDPMVDTEVTINHRFV